MSRAYAGFLGFLGMSVALLRGVKDGAGLEGAVTEAVLAMAALAAVGAATGAIARSTVDASIRATLERQLAEADAAEAG